MLLSLFRGLIRRSLPAGAGAREQAGGPARHAHGQSDDTADAAKVRQLLAFAFARFRANDLAESERALVQGRTLDPGDTDVLLLLSTVLQAQGRKREALALLRGSHGLPPAKLEMQVAIARLA